MQRVYIAKKWLSWKHVTTLPTKWHCIYLPWSHGSSLQFWQKMSCLYWWVASLVTAVVLVCSGFLLLYYYCRPTMCSVCTSQKMTRGNMSRPYQPSDTVHIFMPLSDGSPLQSWWKMSCLYWWVASLVTSVVLVCSFVFGFTPLSFTCCYAPECSSNWSSTQYMTYKPRRPTRCSSPANARWRL